VVHLVDLVSGRVLADAAHPLALVAHQAFGEEDYDRHLAAYVRAGPEDAWWAVEDNAKPGIGAAGARAAWWEPSGASVRVGVPWSTRRGAVTRTDTGVAALLVRVRLPEEAATRSGAPEEVVVVLSDATPPEGPSALGLEVRWHDKPANRLPEATWVGFRPAGVEPASMVLDKLGQDVSPLDVVAGGGRHLHAVGEGVRWLGPGGVVALRTLDAPLVAPGRPSLLDPDPTPLDLAGGAWVCLHDNVWGTNFPMWSEGAARFRFQLSWEPASG
jgi:hypothetical protein